MDNLNQQHPDIPQTAAECQQQIDEIKIFQRSPLHEAFMGYIHRDIRMGISNATQMMPSSIGDFVMREQGFGGLTQLYSFLSWFDDRKQALEETRDEIIARSTQPIQDSSDE